MHFSFQEQPNQLKQGFVLITTILVLSGLVFLAVLVLSLMRIDQSTSRSKVHNAQAEMAVNSAFAEAESVLASAIAGEGVIISQLPTSSSPWQGNNSYQDGAKDLIAWRWDKDQTQWLGICLASGLSISSTTPPLAQEASPAWDDPLRKARIPLWTHPGETISSVWSDPKTQNIGSNNGEVKVRYSWWVEDLGGLIDIKQVGSKFNQNDPFLGRTPQQLPIGNLFAEPQKSWQDASQAQQIFDGSRTHLTQAADVEYLLHAEQLPLLQQQRARQFLYASLPSEPRAEAIPPGIPAKQNGDDYYTASNTTGFVAKANLNQLLLDNDVDGIASHIDLWLPEFEQRKGGFPATESYLKTLAANLIDYADSDNSSTSGSNYRGVDSMPYVNELFLAYHWIGPHEGGKKNKLEFETRTFVELWNPSNQSISGTVGLNISNQRTIENLPFWFGGPRVIQDMLQPNPGIVTYQSRNITIPANGFVVLEFLREDGRPPRYAYDIPSSFPGDPYKKKLGFPSKANTSSYWQLFWNGTLVDQPRGGFQQSQGSLDDGWGKRKWKGINAIALDYSIGQYGDPRGTWYIEDLNKNDGIGFIYAGNYSRKSNWGGRANRRNPNRSYDQVFPSLWPDGGNNSQAGWVPRTPRPPSGNGTDARLPNGQLRNGWVDWPVNISQFPFNQPRLAPTHIANYNDDRLRSITEWGQVFDPAGWISVDGLTYNQKRSAHIPGSNGVPNPSSRTATPKAEPAAAGGYTLAIGRPEFTAFDRDGWRATQLLDLFTLYPENEERKNLAGRININTAPAEVLRVLMADLILALDPEVGAISATQVADEFATAIVLWREGKLKRNDGTQSGPFLTVGELTQLMDEDGSWFGNPARLDKTKGSDQNSDGVSDHLNLWKDALREELFACLYDCCTVTSRNFRIHVTAEIYRTTANGTDEVLARRSRIREVQIDPAELDSLGLDQGGRRKIQTVIERQPL